MKKIFVPAILSGILLLFNFTALAQNANFTLSGTIKDGLSGETIINASIKVDGRAGAVSNEYGFYSLTLPQGDYVIAASYSGYRTDTFSISLTQSIARDISLNTGTRKQSELEEVVVKGAKANDNITNAQTGVERIDMAVINKIPVLFGEKDIIKSIQLLPGIKSGGDGSGSLFVRGGAGDQNLILLDEAPVYNASHLLGFFSTFNSDAIKDVTVYKGTQPAQYGGRLSSALDIRMKDGNKQDYQAEGSIGIISSKLSVQGPIVKDKGSFFISGRRTYADLFLLADKRYSGSKLYFYDLNAKANYTIGARDRIYLSGYFGRDVLGYKDLFGLNWGNATGTLRWNHIVNSKLFSNTSLILSNYDYKVTVNAAGTEFSILSQIRDYNVKQEFQYYANAKHTLRFGLNSIYHNMVPGEVSGNSFNTTTLQNRHTWENAVYLMDDWKPTNRISINAGLRFSSFSVLGKGDYYTLDAQRNVTDTINYQRGDIVKTYYVPEPRLSASFQLDDMSSVKAAYGRNSQYLHLLSNSVSSNPTDKWIPTSNNIKPEIADLVSLGYFRNFKDNMFEAGAEVYYKDMQNQIDYKNGADVYFDDAVETQLLTGKGRAYGLEVLLKKKTGKFTGWISYTLSRTEKQIDGINNGSWYVARQDKTHDVSVVASYDASKRLNVSATWVYSTGNAVTFPSGKYYVDDKIVWLYTERNGYRMPAYHRMDIGATLKLKERKHYSSELAFGIYNVYGRENAFIIDFQENENDPSRTEVVQTALFKFVPSISWNFNIK